MDRWLTASSGASALRRPGSSWALGWAAAGLVLGSLLALLWMAPAVWMAGALARLSQDRVLLLQAQGSVWNGQATLALGSGPGTAGAMALPGRLQWRIRPLWTLDGFPGWGIQVAHPGVLSHPLDFHLSRSAASWTVKLQGGDSGNVPALSAPAAWLAGLGAPWNTLQLSGRLRLDLEEIQWPLAAAGASDARIGVRLQLLNAASRVSTLAVLGHYEFDIRGGPQAVLTLASRPGSALLLEGTGRWTLGGQVEFRGQASAAPGREEALSNLLNIIGRREGARSIIALGGASPPLPSPAPRE